jgi:hypothetical protein
LTIVAYADIFFAGFFLGLLFDWALFDQTRMRRNPHKLWKYEKNRDRVFQIVLVFQAVSTVLIIVSGTSFPKGAAAFGILSLGGALVSLALLEKVWASS